MLNVQLRQLFCEDFEPIFFCIILVFFIFLGRVVGQQIIEEEILQEVVGMDIVEDHWADLATHLGFLESNIGLQILDIVILERHVLRVPYELHEVFRYELLVPYPVVFGTE